MNNFVKKKMIAKNILKPILQETYQTHRSGIYLWERTDEQGITFFYCGQALDIWERTVSHINGFERLDNSIRKRKFKSEENPYGWSFKIIEFCENKNLDEREKFWILQNMRQGKQTYNLNYGGNEGKSIITEGKSTKGYRDGLAQGYKNARRDVAKLFDKNLTYGINGATNKNKQKAYDKFTEFINTGKEEENE